MGLFDFFKKSNKSDVELYYEERNKSTNNQNITVNPPVNSSSQSPFNMLVEDVFSIVGRGTVVTGRIQLGSVSVGETVVLQRVNGSTRNVTVVGIEQFRHRLNSAQAGDNVGLLLQDVARNEIAHGDLLLK